MSTSPAAKFRQLAVSLDDRVGDLQRPRKENTPKRQKEGAYRRIEIAHLCRGYLVLRLLADAWDAGTVPPMLKVIKTKAEVLSMVRTHLDTSGGYYEIRDTCEYADQSELAVELRRFIERQKNPQQQHDEAELARLNALAEMEAKVKFAKIDGFFPTPQQLADQLVYDLQCEPGMSLLEPSAGKGDLVDAVRRRHVDSVEIMCVERHYTLCDILKAKGYHLTRADFTGIEPDDLPKFDRILMNPPYENGQDMDHVRHAFKFLRPGGRLIALMSPGFTFHTSARALRFRNWIEDIEAVVEDLGTPFDCQGVFRQTGVRVVKVTIDKAGVSPRTKAIAPSVTLIEVAPDGTVSRILELLDELEKIRTSCLTT